MFRQLPSLVALLLLAAGAPLAPSPASASSSSNLLSNGSFEVDADVDGVPDGWSLLPGLDHAVALSMGSAQEGARAVEIGDALEEGNAGLRSGAVAVAPGERLRVSGWFLTVATSPVAKRPTTLGVEYARAGSPLPAAPDVSDAATRTTSWSFREFTFLVPADVHEVRVRVDTRGPSVVRVDNVALERVPAGPDPILNPSFELGAHGGRPDQWGLTCAESDKLWGTMAMNGVRSLRLDIVVWPTCPGAVSEPFVLEPGGYVLRADRHFGTANRIATLRVEVYDAATSRGSGAPLATASRDVLGGVPAWVGESLPFCAPAGTAKAHVLLPTPTPSGQVHWDNLRLERVGSCP